MKSVIIAAALFSSQFAFAASKEVTTPTQESLVMVCNAMFSIMNEKDMLACRDLGIAAGIEYASNGTTHEGFTPALDMCNLGDTSHNIKGLRQDALEGLRRVRNDIMAQLGNDIPSVTLGCEYL
ncbi:hypothetical protein [Bdellovibrio bacteriovorus]|uniref:hypothetical protein n=1 Tax=Bdellovibrio TaxID=958 RepID=UPI0035A98971